MENLYLWLGFFSGSLETKLQFFMGIKTFNSPLQF